VDAKVVSLVMSESSAHIGPDIEGALARVRRLFEQLIDVFERSRPRRRYARVIDA
jgi:hypothetical protein